MPFKRGVFQVVAFDPGGVTGWFHAAIDIRVFMEPDMLLWPHVIQWRTGEFEGTDHEQYTAAIERIHKARYGKMPFLGNVHVVSEDFDLVQTRGRAEDLLSPVRFNAVVGYECDKQFGLELQLLKRGLRISSTPDRLEAWGFPSPWRNRWSKSGRGKDSFAATQNGTAYLRRLKIEANQHPWKKDRMDVGRFAYPLGVH